MSSPKKMTVVQLRAELSKQGLPTKGTKPDLVSRLENFSNAQKTDVPEAVATAVSLESVSKVTRSSEATSVRHSMIETSTEVQVKTEKDSTRLAGVDGTERSIKVENQAAQSDLVSSEETKAQSAVELSGVRETKTVPSSSSENSENLDAQASVRSELKQERTETVPVTAGEEKEKTDAAVVSNTGVKDVQEERQTQNIKPTQLELNVEKITDSDSKVLHDRDIPGEERKLLLDSEDTVDLNQSTKGSSLPSQSDAANTRAPELVQSERNATDLNRAIVLDKASDAAKAEKAGTEDFKASLKAEQDKLKTPTEIKTETHSWEDIDIDKEDGFIIGAPDLPGSKVSDPRVKDSASPRKKKPPPPPQKLEFEQDPKSQQRCVVMVNSRQTLAQEITRARKLRTVIVHPVTPEEFGSPRLQPVLKQCCHLDFVFDTHKPPSADVPVQGPLVLVFRTIEDLKGSEPILRHLKPNIRVRLVNVDDNIETLTDNFTASSWKPDNFLKCTICLEDLPVEVTETMLEEVLPGSSVTLGRDAHGCLTGSASAEFQNPQTAKDALAKCHNLTLCGMALNACLLKHVPNNPTVDELYKYCLVKYNQVGPGVEISQAGKNKLLTEDEVSSMTRKLLSLRFKLAADWGKPQTPDNYLRVALLEHYLRDDGKHRQAKGIPNEWAGKLQKMAHQNMMRLPADKDQKRDLLRMSQKALYKRLLEILPEEYPVETLKVFQGSEGGQGHGHSQGQVHCQGQGQGHGQGHGQGQPNKKRKNKQQQQSQEVPAFEQDAPGPVDQTQVDGGQKAHPNRKKKKRKQRSGNQAGPPSGEPFQAATYAELQQKYQRLPEDDWSYEDDPPPGGDQGMPVLKKPRLSEENEQGQGAPSQFAPPQGEAFGGNKAKAKKKKKKKTPNQGNAGQPDALSAAQNSTNYYNQPPGTDQPMQNRPPQGTQSAKNKKKRKRSQSQNFQGYPARGGQNYYGQSYEYENSSNYQFGNQGTDGYYGNNDGYEWDYNDGMSAAPSSTDRDEQNQAVDLLLGLTNLISGQQGSNSEAQALPDHSPANYTPLKGKPLGWSWTGDEESRPGFNYQRRGGGRERGRRTNNKKRYFKKGGH